MLVHDSTTRRILGFMNHDRYKLIGDINAAKIMSRYPIRTTNRMYTFSVLNNNFVKELCKHNKIQQVDGYTPLNIPCDMITNHGFDKTLNTFMHYTSTCDHNDHLSHLRNLSEFVGTPRDEPKRIILVVPSGYGARSDITTFTMKHPDLFHVLCKIPRGSTTLVTSDHWYQKNIKSLVNPYDLNILIACNEASLQETPLCKEELEDIVNDVSTKKIQVDVRCKPGTFSDHFKINMLPRETISTSHKIQTPIKGIFTDASIFLHQNKIDIGVGIWSDDYDIKECWKLDTINDINYAELGALFIALLRIKSKGYKNDIVIMTDSLTSIKLLQRKIICEKYEPLVRSIIYLVDQLPGSVTFTKVKAHSGVVGNENADFLARYAVQNDVGHFKLKIC